MIDYKKDFENKYNDALDMLFEIKDIVDYYIVQEMIDGLKYQLKDIQILYENFDMDFIKRSELEVIELYKKLDLNAEELGIIN